MVFAGSNLLAVLAAALAAFVAGAVWYGALSKQWLAAQGLKPEDAQMKPSLFALTFVCELFMAFVLSGLIFFRGAQTVTIGGGIATGLLVWAGFVMMTLIINNAYAFRSRQLTLIDGGHWLIVFVVMGAVIGWFGG